MKNILLLAVLPFLFGSCGDQKKEASTKIVEVISNDTVPRDSHSSIDQGLEALYNVEEHILSENGEQSTLVETLWQFENGDRYIFLAAKGRINSEDYLTLYGKSIPFFWGKDSIERRGKIDSKLIEKFFDTISLDTLYYFDPTLKKSIALEQIQFEHYNFAIGDGIVSSYNDMLDIPEVVVVTSREMDFKESLSPIHLNEKRVRNLDKISLEDHEDIFLSKYFVTAKLDTISLVSVGNYRQEEPNRILVYKNGQKTDSIYSEFVLLGLSPAPIAQEEKEFYMVDINIPDTDVEWNSLIKLDTDTGKLYFFERNRINI